MKRELLGLLLGAMLGALVMLYSVRQIHTCPEQETVEEVIEIPNNVGILSDTTIISSYTENGDVTQIRKMIYYIVNNFHLYFEKDDGVFMFSGDMVKIKTLTDTICYKKEVCEEN